MPVVYSEACLRYVVYHGVSEALRLRSSSHFREPKLVIFRFYENCDTTPQFSPNAKFAKIGVGKIRSYYTTTAAPPTCLRRGVWRSIMQADCVSSSPVGALLADVIHILRGVTALAVA